MSPSREPGKSVCKGERSGAPWLRSLASFVHRQTQQIASRSFSPAELRQDAMVFAPHPDDETLGCGGTVISKRLLGANVDLVFMTDGAGSHPELISREELARERQREAMAASAALGVHPQRVTWFGFPDGNLLQHHATALSRVVRILCDRRPAQVFAPYRRYEHPDHVETGAIVRAALRQTGLPTMLCEYPIWYWKQWPFVRDDPPPTKRILLGLLRAWLNTGLLAPFNVRLDLAAVAETKRSALAEHKTQMARRHDDPRWHTLGDLSCGDFIDSFFAAEIFCCTRLP